MTTLFLTQLQLLRDPTRAIWDKAYHKSTREHWGVTAPNAVRFIRSVAKELSEEELLSLAKELWDTNLFDPMLSAARILSLPKVKPSQKLWGMLISFLPQVDGWALEDHLAHVAWKCIRKDEMLLGEVEEWTKHPNFWMRRAALVYTLPFAKLGSNPERMLGWASGYASDPEWFIQKAIGWWLRVLGSHNPERVVAFLEQHWPQLKGVVRKEATRKLAECWRAGFG